MNEPDGAEIRARLERQHQRRREEMRRREDAMDAFAVEAVHALTAGIQDVADRSATAMSRTSFTAEVEAGARSAIGARRAAPASAGPTARPGEPHLRAALRGIVADYAQPLTPSDPVVNGLEAMSGIALDEADSYGLWAHIQLEEALQVRAAMPNVIEIVTDRAESLVIAELVAAAARLAEEYPDAPWPDAERDGLES